MTTVLIVTGPQGSGNHLFSKILALHSDVSGWSALLSEYWIPHASEPFNACWDNPELLTQIDWSSNDFWVTGISCPYAKDGSIAIPKYEAFISMLQKLGIEVKLAIIGRDETVLKYQQSRVRDNITLHHFKDNLPALMKHNPVFISQELLFLYKEHYVESIGKMLDFPVDTSHELFNVIISQDANEKYFQAISNQPLDKITRRVSGLSDK